MFSSSRQAGRLASGLVGALIVALPVCAQVEVGGLDTVDPWGIGFLQRGEPAMPTGMWTASRAEDLLPLMKEVRTRNLTPAERTLLRRVVLSPAARPKGERAGALLAERARILYELGEAEAAATLYAQIDDGDDAPTGEALSPDALAVDLQLALGNDASACVRTRGYVPEGMFWAKLRAVCAVLAGDTAAAELAIELAQAQGVNDPWLFNAVFAASGELPAKPPARYGSGLELALSLKAGLEPPQNAVTAARPDLAAAMAVHAGIAPPLRVIAAGVSAESGLIDAKAHRTAYEALLSVEGFRPSNEIEVALVSVRDPNADRVARARAISNALKAASANPARHAAVARLLMPDISALTRTDTLAPYALDFARAALATGDVRTAAAWSSAAEAEGAPLPDPFDLAFLDATLLLAGADASPASVKTLATALVEAAETRSEKTRAARLFALWSAFGTVLPLDARSLMVGQDNRSGTVLSDWDLVRLAAAADADAAGEVVVTILAATRGEPGRIGPAEMTAVLSALRQIGALDAARTLALESTAYWR